LLASLLTHALIFTKLNRSLLKIFNATPSYNKALDVPYVRPIPFTCIAISKEMPTPPVPTAADNISGPGFMASFAFVLATVDQRGHVFVLDFPKNK
jgi:hypothetical protein